MAAPDTQFQTPADYDKYLQGVLADTDALVAPAPAKGKPKASLKAPTGSYDTYIQDTLKDVDKLLAPPKPTGPLDNVAPEGGPMDTIWGTAEGAWNTVKGLFTGAAGQATGLLDIPVHAAGTAMGLKILEPADVEAAVSDIGTLHPDTRRGERTSEAVQEGVGDILGAPGRFVNWVTDVMGPQRDQLEQDLIKKGWKPEQAKAFALRKYPTMSPEDQDTQANIFNSAAMAVGAGKAPEMAPRGTIEEPAEPPPPDVQARSGEPAYSPPRVNKKVEEKPAEAAPKPVKKKFTTLADAVAALGGVNKKTAISDFGFDPKDISAFHKGVKGVFREEGQDPDRVAEILSEQGWPVNDENGNYDSAILMNLLDEHVRGDNPTHHPEDAEALVERQERSMREQDEAREADRNVVSLEEARDKAEETPDLSRQFAGTSTSTHSPYAEGAPPADFVLGKIRLKQGDRDVVVPVKTEFEAPEDEELYKIGEQVLASHGEDAEPRPNTSSPSGRELIDRIRRYIRDNDPAWRQNDDRANLAYARAFAREVRDQHQQGYNVLRDHLEDKFPDNPKGELRANPHKYAFTTKVPRWTPRDLVTKCF